MPPRLRPSSSLANVRYEIRGPLARRAAELEKAGQTVIKLNIGNVGAFGFRAPEAMRAAVAEGLASAGADAYCHQRGITAAREAVAAGERARGIADADAEHVFIGNGCSELILFALKALLEPGDEVLVPSPDYPLWTAAANINGGRAVHYPCAPERGFLPDPGEVERMVTAKTRALVIITPNNPTGAVYPRALLQALVAIAEKHGLVVLSDEIYDQIVYDGVEHVPVATLVKSTLCGTFNGLSKVHRACGWRVGWLSFSGDRSTAGDYFLGLDLLASLRLCANAPGQYAVAPAIADRSIRDLVKPGGRLYQSRKALIDGVGRSKHLSVMQPGGALYAFIKIGTQRIRTIDDQQFALDLLEDKKVLIAPGRSFNVPYTDHFRSTVLPDEATIAEVFGRIEELLDEYARR